MNKIGIHHRPDSFSRDWINCCRKNSVPFKIVNCYDSDIMDQLLDCNTLMWHFHHANYKDFLFAKQLVYSVQKAGKTVFPDFYTAWTFNDKIGQKYLLESIGAPTVPTYVFYDKEDAQNWANKAVFPKVFKLRNGAGSEHVRLVENEKSARKLINQAFGQGFSQYAAKPNLIERFRKFRNGKTGIMDLAKGVVRLGYTTNFNIVAGNEKGYIYFQDFIPGNDHDVRVVVVGNKAFAIKRSVRENDFRASGSGINYMSKGLFEENTIKLAFEITERLKAKCVAFDFIFEGEVPKVVEISYGFLCREVNGYWDKRLNWHNEQAKPPDWILEQVLN